MDPIVFIGKKGPRREDGRFPVELYELDEDGALIVQRRAVVISTREDDTLDVARAIARLRHGRIATVEVDFRPDPNPEED